MTQAGSPDPSSNLSGFVRGHLVGLLCRGT